MTGLLPRACEVCLAWIADACLGDPESMPHPVRIIGRCISALETRCRKRIRSQRLAGIVVGSCVPAGAFVVTLIVIKAAASLGPLAGSVASCALVYTCLSTRCLGDEARAVLRAVSPGDLDAARRRLARIVGRDTDGLTAEEIARAAVETVSENTVDGIIAPLMYAFIGGAPLAIAYKAINTLDSMVGYRDERYREFGWFSARLDDAANYVPARLCLVLVPLACLLMHPRRALKALKAGLRDGRKSPSPNAGFPEACFAGALGIQLGGRCTYRGAVSSKPLIGVRERKIEPSDIDRSIRLMWLSSGFALAVFAALWFIVMWLKA